MRSAFNEMRLKSISEGARLKTTTDLGEIETIVACMMIHAQIICSNDFDIRSIIEQENYCISTDEADRSIIQDSAEDFCVYCCQNKIAKKAM